MTRMVIVGKCLLPILLKQRHMSLTDLSDKTGISLQQLSKYINSDTKMSLSTALLVAWALKCHVEELYAYSIK